MTDKPRTPDAQLAHALRFHGIDLVLDVGANRGQYAKRLRAHGYDGRIVSIEPLPDLRDALLAEAAGDPLWTVAAAMAFGDAPGEAVIERSAESDMSSLLPQSALLRAMSPSSVVVERVAVPVARLDDLAPAWLGDGARPFLKLDVQGYEARVLDGAAALLPRLAGVQVELSLLECYEGERLWRESVDWLEAQGFSLCLVLPGYYERKLGRHLQMDGVFVRDGMG
ncbi:FkbM family methyltransferase [Marinivivus vitaminiproducens]|uniref:FkbM family methyltransferase n=1 Tax=Marinivivus vitaminiproducens TaxID=3035935 RepID=UPI0027AB03F6|nr:FkbM family methyltransferase [Geminicoccaceae bacterium SCSIO 64248]